MSKLPYRSALALSLVLPFIADAGPRSVRRPDAPPSVAEFWEEGKALARARDQEDARLAKLREARDLRGMRRFVVEVSEAAEWSIGRGFAVLRETSRRNPEHEAPSSLRDDAHLFLGAFRAHRKDALRVLDRALEKGEDSSPGAADLGLAMTDAMRRTREMVLDTLLQALARLEEAGADLGDPQG